MKLLPEYYTQPTTFKVENTTELWAILDEVLLDALNHQEIQNSFWFNRKYITDCFLRGELYGMKLQENDQMRNTKAFNDPIFCKGSMYILPCFCVIVKTPDSFQTEVMWISNRIRDYSLLPKMAKDIQSSQSQQQSINKLT